MRVSARGVRRIAARLPLVGLLAVASCGAPAANPIHPITIRVETDAGVPLVGVPVILDGRPFGTSDAVGLVQKVLRAPDGASVRLAHECPDEYKPAEATTLRLHAFKALDPEDDAGLTVTLRCVPKTWRYAFAVDAPGHADLPVRVGDEVVARTDTTGIARWVSAMPAGGSVRVELVTDAHPDLRPANPSRVFTLPDTSDVFVWTQTLEPKSGRRRASRGSREESSRESSEPRRAPERSSRETRSTASAMRDEAEDEPPRSMPTTRPLITDLGD